MLAQQSLSENVQSDHMRQSVESEEFMNQDISVRSSSSDRNDLKSIHTEGNFVKLLELPKVE